MSFHCKLQIAQELEHFIKCHSTLLKMGHYSNTMVHQKLGQLLKLQSSILTILLTCPNNDTSLCYCNNRIKVQ